MLFDMSTMILLYVLKNDLHIVRNMHYITINVYEMPIVLSSNTEQLNGLMCTLCAMGCPSALTKWIGIFNYYNHQSVTGDYST